MVRTVLGGLVGGIVLYLVGFIFWGTPLSGIAFSTIDAQASANLQAALGQGLTLSGTGTYIVPNPATQQGTTLFGQGPIATVHFNTSGFPVVDSGSLLAGLVLALIAGLLIAFALRIAAKGEAFAARVKIVVLIALAITLYVHIGQPIFNHYGYRYFVYSFLADFLGFAAAGVVIARWFGPRAVTVGTVH